MTWIDGSSTYCMSIVWFYLKDMAGSDYQDIGLAKDMVGTDSLRVHECDNGSG